MEPQTIDMEIDKQTANTVRYKEIPNEGEPAKIQTQYIQKWVLGNEPPQKIQVTIVAV